MSSLYSVRPIEEKDIPHLMRWSQENSGGISTLLNAPQFLDKQLRRSIQWHRQFPDLTPIDGFAPILYFVLTQNADFEDKENPILLGCCGLRPRLSPDTVYLEEVEGKLIKGYYRKPLSELCALFLNKPARGMGLGKLLSWSRFLFMYEHQEYFASELIAQFRGLLDKDGQSPFWNCLRPHLSGPLSDLDFLKAHSAVVTKKHPLILPDTLPSLHELALPFSLPTLHENTVAAFAMLEKIGFRKSSRFDPTDAGMHAFCTTQELFNRLKITPLSASNLRFTATEKPKTHLLAISEKDVASAFSHNRFSVTQVTLDPTEKLYYTEDKELFKSIQERKLKERREESREESREKTSEKSPQSLTLLPLKKNSLNGE